MLFIYTTTKIKFCSNQGRISILDRQPSNSARHFSSFSSSNLQALPLVTPSVSCSAGKAKHKIDIDIHSERSIRLARSAKMANIFSSNSTISSATAAHVASPASSLRDLTFFGSGQPLSYAGADGFGSKTQTLQRQSLSLLFLNQGLSSAELAKLRSSLRLLGLNITHVPARFWSNSFFVPLTTALRQNGQKHAGYKQSRRKIKHALHGGIIWLHTFWPLFSASTYAVAQQDRDGRFYDDSYGAALAGRFINVGASISGIFEHVRQGRFLNKHGTPGEVRHHRFPLSVNFKTIPGKPNPIVISKLILPWDFFSSGKALSSGLNFGSAVAEPQSGHEKSSSGVVPNLLGTLDVSLKAWFFSEDGTTDSLVKVASLEATVPALFESLHENRLTFAGMLVTDVHCTSWVYDGCGFLPTVRTPSHASTGEVDSLRSRLLTRSLTLPTPPAQFVAGQATGQAACSKTFLLYANSITQPAQLCFEPFFFVAPAAKYLFCL